MVENTTIFEDAAIILATFPQISSPLEPTYRDRRCGVVRTPYYVALEVLIGREYDEKIDARSAGVMMYIILSGSQLLTRASPIARFLGHKASALKSFDAALLPPCVKTLYEKERDDALGKRAELKLELNRRQRLKIWWMRSGWVGRNKTVFLSNGSMLQVKGEISKDVWMKQL
ncbi:hypothetical protein ACFX2C_007273 [Malus domestica]